MTRTPYAKASVRQTTRFYREGSALAGTIAGGPVGLETGVDLESDEPPERIRRLVDMAEASCYAMQSLAQNVAITSTFTLNGAPLPEAVAT